MGFFSRSAPLPDYTTMPVDERLKDPHFQSAFASLPGFDNAVLAQNADHGGIIDPPQALVPGCSVGVFVITPSHMGYAYVYRDDPKKVKLVTNPVHRGELRHKGKTFIIAFQMNGDMPTRAWSFVSDDHDSLLAAFKKVRG
jgi:hypothetical protein